MGGLDFVHNTAGLSPADYPPRGRLDKPEAVIVVAIRRRVPVRYFLDGQVDHLPGRVVRREYLSSFGRFVNDIVQRLDGIGGVNGFAYLRGILE